MASERSIPPWLPSLHLAAPVLRPLYEQLAPLELLARAAYVDSLTQLANKAALAALIEQFDEREEVQAAIAVDLKGFKAINDTHGHEAGDAAIKAAAEVVTRIVGQAKGIAAHPSGDEFCAIVPVDRAKSCADDLAAELQSHSFEYESQRIFVAGVVGYALPLDNSESLERRMKRADLACNEAKHSAPGRAVEHTVAFSASQKSTRRFRCTGCSARVDVEVPEDRVVAAVQWKCPNCSGALGVRDAEAAQAGT